MNISKTIRDRAISREFLTHRVVQECPMQRGKISRVSYAKGKKFNFRHFYRPSWILRKIKIENIFKMVRDRAILSEFLTHRVVQQYSVPRGKISVFHHFWLPSWISVENENCEYLAKGISSPVMLGGRYIPRQWCCLFLDSNSQTVCPIKFKLDRDIDHHHS